MSDNYLPINLPSGNIPYPTNQVKIRPYTGEDEILLSQMNEENLDEQYQEMLRRTISGVDPDLITVGDRLYVILWQFINSYSNTMPVKYICSHCLREVSVQAKLNEIETTDLPEDFEYPKKIKIQEKEIEVRFLTCGDLLEVERYSKSHDDGHIFQYALCFDYDGMNFEQKKDFLKKNLRALAAIRVFQEKYYHGPTMEVKVKCPKEDCGKEEMISIPFRFDFVYPSSAFLSAIAGEGI